MFNFLLNFKYYNLSKNSKDLDKYLIYLNELLKSSNKNDLLLWYSNEIIGATNSITNLENKCKIKNCCSKGCSSCCKQSIYISPAEFHILKHKLKNLDTISQIKLKNKAHEVCSKIDQNKIPLSTNKPISYSDQAIINNEYYKLNIPCILLDNNLCSIYEIRPVVCWSYRNYRRKKDCQLNGTPKYGLPYIDLGVYVTNRMYKYIKVNFIDYYLLPYAIDKIL